MFWSLSLKQQAYQLWQLSKWSSPWLSRYPRCSWDWIDRKTRSTSILSTTLISSSLLIIWVKWIVRQHSCSSVHKNKPTLLPFKVHDKLETMHLQISSSWKTEVYYMWGPWPVCVETYKIEEQSKCFAPEPERSLNLVCCSLIKLLTCWRHPLEPVPWSSRCWDGEIMKIFPDCG